MPSSRLDRRRFLSLGGSALVLPLVSCAAGNAPGRSPLRLGLIADLHHGLEPRALERLEDFVAAARARAADMIVQLGDFNYSTPEDRPCLAVWESFAGERHHVLGNHDMDKNGKAHVLEAWQMPARYYAFDRDGWHFVVLDRNHVKNGDDYLPYAKGNYFGAAGVRGHADPEQLAWLAADLRATDRPTIVFAHQGLGVVDTPYPEDDGRAPIEAVLAAANRESRAAGNGDKVVACFCGHEHLDRHNRRDGVHYVWINSASYSWLGGEWPDKKYGRMAPYADPLYAFVDLHPDRLVIHGRRSTFVSPSPEQRGFPRWREVSAAQQDRELGLEAGRR